MKSLFENIVAFSSIFFAFWLMFKTVKFAFVSVHSTKREHIMIMKKKTFIFRLLKFIFYLVIYIAWLTVLYYFSNLSYGDKINNATDKYVVFSIIAIAFFNFVLLVEVIKSLRRFVTSLIAMVNQSKNTSYNNLLKAIDRGDSKEIVFNYKLLKQSRFKYFNHAGRIFIVEGYWLIVLSSLINEGEIEEARKLSENIRGSKIVKHGTPLTKKDLSMKNIKNYTFKKVKGVKNKA